MFRMQNHVVTLLVVKIECKALINFAGRYLLTSPYCEKSVHSINDLSSASSATP
jgi:hypothetical protein